MNPSKIKVTVLKQISKLIPRNLELTRRCNFRCVYCGSDCFASHDSTELTSRQWKSAIKQIADDFHAPDIMIALTGGESLLRCDIFEILAYLNQLEFPFGMVTNGSLIDKETSKKIVDSGIGAISVSLDAPPEINDALRGKGSTAKAEKAIHNLKEQGYRGILEIISTITKPTVAYLEELRLYISRIKVARWRVASVMPVGRAASRPDLLLDSKDIKTLQYVIKIIYFSCFHKVYPEQIYQVSCKK